jgi:uncharacterized protein (TIGR00297 family)
LGKSTGTASSTLRRLSRPESAKPFDSLDFWDALHHVVCCLVGMARRTSVPCDTDSISVTRLIHSSGLPAAVVAIGFAVVARTMGAVTDGGALVGVMMAFVLMLAAGLSGFVPLGTLFLLTLVTTRWGYERKQRLGVAERGRGRTASQVLANLCASAVCVLPVIWFPEIREVLLIAAMAALAEAAADTVSSEVGQAIADHAYMITDFRTAPIGTNGAISVEGTLSGCVAASIVAWVSAFIGVVPWQWTPVISLAGVAGMFLDSVLGATWENSGRMGNDAVNFASTVFAADLALVAAMVIERVRI